MGRPLAHVKRQAEQRRVATLEAENWNFKHPVGTSVVLRKDGGDDLRTKTRSEAYVSESGHTVCFFEGVSGYYLIEKATAL